MLFWNSGLLVTCWNSNLANPCEVYCGPCIVIDDSLWDAMSRKNESGPSGSKVIVVNINHHHGKLGGGLNRNSNVSVPDPDIAKA